MSYSEKSKNQFLHKNNYYKTYYQITIKSVCVKWYIDNINAKLTTNEDWSIFSVTIGSAKKTGQVQSYSDAPIVAYSQDNQNSCYVISLDSSVKASNELVDANTIATLTSS